MRLCDAVFLDPLNPLRFTAWVRDGRVEGRFENGKPEVDRLGFPENGWRGTAYVVMRPGLNHPSAFRKDPKTGRLLRPLFPKEEVSVIKAAERLWTARQLNPELCYLEIREDLARSA